MSAASSVGPAPYPKILAASREHRLRHGCGGYSFEDGAGLAALCAELRPARVLELGTALGYTACCLASGYNGAHVDTVEGDPVHAALARRHIIEAGLERHISLHAGDFEAVVSKLNGLYGLVFFDGFAPSPALTASLQAKVDAGGAFVCGNIGLATNSEAKKVKALFGDRTAWRPIKPLESGATPVWLRL